MCFCLRYTRMNDTLERAFMIKVTVSPLVRTMNKSRYVSALSLLTELIIEMFATAAVHREHHVQPQFLDRIKSTVYDVIRVFGFSTAAVDGHDQRNIYVYGFCRKIVDITFI